MKSATYVPVGGIFDFCLNVGRIFQLLPVYFFRFCGSDCPQLFDFRIYQFSLFASPHTRIDDYIAKSAGFAKPILEELRRRVHAAVPGVTETLKWSMPYFVYKGKTFAGMAAFKAHCAFGFWHPRMRTGEKSAEAMGQFGRIASLQDLPSKAAFEKLAKQAMKLADGGAKAPPRPVNRGRLAGSKARNRNTRRPDQARCSSRSGRMSGT